MKNLLLFATLMVNLIPSLSFAYIVEDAEIAYNNGDYENAISIWTDLASNGDVESQTALIKVYSFDPVIKPNSSLALKWAKKAIEQNSAYAKQLLGLKYYLGKGVDRNKKIAFGLIKEAAEMDLIDSQYILATGFYCMTINKEYGDHKQCIKWLTIAADNNHMKANYELSIKLIVNDKSKKISDTAIKLLNKAANLGSVEAQTTLGSLYLRGKGYRKKITKDFHKASNWYTRAADQGDIASIFKLSEMYIKASTSAPTQVNLVNAYRWTHINNFLKYFQHVNLTEDIKNQMSVDLLKQANMKIKDWKKNVCINIESNKFKQQACLLVKKRTQ